MHAGSFIFKTNASKFCEKRVVGQLNFHTLALIFDETISDLYVGRRASPGESG